MKELYLAIIELGTASNKKTLITFFGLAGTLIANAFGGWNNSLTTLCIFMLLDYLSGMVLAGVFHKSAKTESGGLSSREGLKGIIKKVIMLLMVLIAYRLDMVIGTEYIRDMVILAFIANEAISLLENFSAMGLPIPSAIKKAIDIINQKSEKKDGEE